MHVADALISTPVALTAGAISVALIAVAGREIKKDQRPDLVPLMGVMGAFVFAAQMINFSIPGTGSSGHIIGGVLLSALLGPWAAFLTLVSVLIIQCLIFADGGLLALGCNIFNMGALTCLVAYPLIFKPFLKFPAPIWKIVAVSVLTCVIGLELGAFFVTAETELSGVTALPFGIFLGFMSGIHLLIGIGEGLATAAVLVFVAKTRPSMLEPATTTNADNKLKAGQVIIIFAVAALLTGGVLAFFASPDPDGLEWSIEKITGSTELQQSVSALALPAEKIQSTTSVLPDYENSLSGIIGGVVTLLLAWSLGSLMLARHKVKKPQD